MRDSWPTSINSTKILNGGEILDLLLTHVILVELAGSSYMQSAMR